MTDKKIKRIPYGLANYERVVQTNCYYVDKTMYLKAIQEASDYLFFIRPRRFGKSLFLSMMEMYYDVHYKDRFEELFKGTWIYNHPDAERGAYLVLSLNFSGIDPEAGKLEGSFLNYIQDTAKDFISRYYERLSDNPDRDYFAEKIKKSDSAADILSTLLQICKGARQKLYVLVDEYDNFANTILSTIGQDAYKDLTHGTGFFRTFFNVLKKGTSGAGAPISRSFITGVSPITMDDVTSGYNIGENTFMDPAFKAMLGFTENDVAEMLEYYKTMGLINHDTGMLLDIMRQWYGNYVFSTHAMNESVLFNSDMVLFFLRGYFKINNLPDDLIDRNVRMDYGKLRHLIIIDKGEKRVSNGNFERLKEIVKEGKISSNLVKGFPLEELTHRDNFISLLFYFGLLTIKSAEITDLTLMIPNETIRRLFYDYIKEGYEDTGAFALDLYSYNRLMKAMALDGEWKPLIEFLTARMRESMSLRDLISGEKAVHAFLNVYLGLTSLYIIHREKEMNKGYADIVMEPFLARYEGLKYSYVLEIKYIKAGVKPGDARVKRLKAEAEEQLKQYAGDEKFGKVFEKTTLVKLVLIFSGHDAVYIGEAE